MTKCWTMLELLIRDPLFHWRTITWNRYLCALHVCKYIFYSFPLFYFYCRWKRKLIKKQFTSIIRVHKHCITMHAFQLYLFFYNTSTNMLTEIILNCFHCVSLLRKYDINWRKIVVITFFSLLLRFHFELEVPSH